MSDPREAASRREALVNLGLASLTGALLWLSFPPVDWGYLAWVALVPWLLMLARASLGWAAAASGAVGFFLYAALLHWLRFVTVAGWLMLAFYCTLYWVAAAWAVRWLKRRGIPFLLAAPLTLTVLELGRATLLTGFPFLFLGHTQYRYLALIQVADLAGAYGVTFLVAMVNGFLADRGAERWAVSGRRIMLGAAVAGAVALAAAYGLVRSSESAPRRGPLVGVVQGNVPQDLKHSPSLEEALRVLQRHIRLSREMRERRPDLIIWAETMVPAPMNVAWDTEATQELARHERERFRVYGRFLETCRQEITALARETGAHLLVGAETWDRANRRFNSAYLLSPEGRILDRYDKIHLVPFGEYTPLAGMLPFLKRLRPAVMGPDLAPGRGRRLFDLTRDGRGYKFGVTICYEDAEADLFRKFVRDGADFMVNITNDGWFRDSSELDHHLAVCVFRAVENRTAIARCANTGISALIGPDGRILERVVAPDGRYREVEGWIAGRLPGTKDRPAFYTEHGDVFAYACLAGGLIVAVLALRRKRT